MKTKNAYAERNQLVALLARLYPSGIQKTPIEGWDPEWFWCVYIDLPNGQVSWHIHESELPYFEALPPYPGKWDGHTTEEKYDRIHSFCTQLDKPTPYRFTMLWDLSQMEYPPS